MLFSVVFTRQRYKKNCYNIFYSFFCERKIVG